MLKMRERLDRTIKVFLGGSAGLVALTLGAGLVLSSTTVQADDNTVSQASVTVSTACQMSGTIVTPHEANIPASTYRSDIGQTRIRSICNDAGGYAVYAVGYTNTEFGRNDMLGADTGRTIATSTATSGDTSSWAMKLTPVAGDYAPTIQSDTEGSFANYHTVPAEYTKVALYAGTTDNNTRISEMDTTYASYVASNQGPDEYTGKVKYSLIHPSDSTDKPCSGTYTISYNANTGSGNMDSQTACVDKAIGLLPNGFTAPVPSEYQFAVWNTQADGSGYTYYSGQTVTNLASMGGTVTLYAQWAPKYIQDLTADMCSIVANEQAFTVYDRRDGNDYKVRYLNGACWMVQNLRITGTVNASNSNFSTYSNVDVCEGDLTAGNSYDQPRCHDSGNTTNGVWYNYAAASAKTILTSSNTTTATEDICPAGWSLPGYDTTSPAPAGTVNSLVSSVSTDVAKFSPVTGGNYYYGSPDYTGLGYWWSTVANYSNSRYLLLYYGSDLTTSSSGRDFGLYVRCVRVTAP